MQRTIMTIHAHPDDEATSTGGLLARYAQEGSRTVLVTCTGGELGEIADPALASPDTLRQARYRELLESCQILGISALHLLGYRDSGMAGLPENEHPRSFNKADLEEATRRLVGIIRTERPDVLVTYDEQGFYGHPDHIQANRITVAAWGAAGDPRRYPDLADPWAPSKLYYTTIPHSAMRRFGQRLREAGMDDFDGEERSWGVPDEMITAVLDVSRWVERKYAALMAHRTQMGANVFFARMPPTLFHELFAEEHLIRVASRVSAPEQEDDILAGLEE